MRRDRWRAWAMSSSSSTMRTRGARAKSFMGFDVAAGAKAMVRGHGRFRALGVEVARGGSHDEKGACAAIFAPLQARLASPTPPRRGRGAGRPLGAGAARRAVRVAAREPLAGG